MDEVPLRQQRSCVHHCWNLIVFSLIVSNSIALGAVAAGQTGLSASESTSTSTLSAEDIFSRARDVWTNQLPPSTFTYALTVRASQNGGELVRHYRGRYSLGTFAVGAFSDEETANPFTPRGVNVALVFTLAKGGGGSETIGREIGPKPASMDYLGIPELSPLYSFGLARSRQHASAPTAEQSVSSTSFDTIGHVETRQRDYDVTLLGIEAYAGSPSFHLTLRPLHDPGRYRLREMWIDTRTFLTKKVTTDGNFTDGPSLRVKWSTTFHQMNDVQYIDTEHAEETLDYGPRRKYEGVTIAFDSVRPLESFTSMLMVGGLPAQANELREPP